MTVAWELLEKANKRAERLASELGAATGHMANALFELQSDGKRATAIRILQSGLDRIDAFNKTMRDLAEQIRKDAAS
jgi:hypothetical protein